jgi:hypothetical protein
MIFTVYNSAIPSSTHDHNNMVAASKHTKSPGHLRAAPIFHKRIPPTFISAVIRLAGTLLGADHEPSC